MNNRQEFNISIAGITLSLMLPYTTYKKLTRITKGKSSIKTGSIYYITVTTEYTVFFDSSEIFCDGYGHYCVAIDNDKKKGKILIYDIEDIDILYNAIRQIFMKLLYKESHILLHAASVYDNDKVRIFAARSGGGKSTIAYLSQDKKVLSDDQTVIKRVNGIYKVWGLPSPTISPLPDPNGYELDSIYLLRKSTNILLKPINKSLALANLVTCPINPSTTLIDIQLAKMDVLLNHIPCYMLYFNKTKEFWSKIYESRPHTEVCKESYF